MSSTGAHVPLSFQADLHQGIGGNQSASEPPFNLNNALTHDLVSSLKSEQRQLLLKGEAVFDLSMVNPDLGPPRMILDRLLEAVTKPVNHRYAVSRGVRRLREAFAEKYKTRFSVTLDPEREVCVCLGSKDATYHALRTLVRGGDKVIVSSPSYPAHLSAIALVGGQVVKWQYSMEPAEARTELSEILESSGAKVVLLNFPSNPGGVVVTEEWWRGIVEVADRHGAAVINDFVYGEMCFSGNLAPSLLAAATPGSTCLEVYSLSKAYNVPGWRVGALMGAERVVREVARLKSHADYGLFLPLQYAAATALTAEENLTRSTVTAYERRIKVLTQGLQRLGWEVQLPAAGASVWARFPEDMAQESASHSGVPEQYRSISTAHRLLNKHRVLVAPGVIFGPEWDDYVRFAAVVSEERMREVVGALAQVRHQA